MNKNIKVWAGYSLAVLALYIGYILSQNYYFNAEDGLGYALGIIGGSTMLTLLVYPLRKRYKQLRFLGPVRHWFRIHMMFGIIGPILILCHSSFQLGATNSNVALFSMLTVAISGLVGRYLYKQIHNGLYGRLLTLEEIEKDCPTRKQAEARVRRFHLFERLFSYWHMFHLPIFFMLVITAIIHIISVHMY